MEFLILCPPVATPSETPSGAFLLAAGLSARGRETALFDLNLEFYWDFFETAQAPDLKAALDYILLPGGEGKKHRFEGYKPERHRGAVGVLHKKLARFSMGHPGWHLSLMDLEGPAPVHDLVHLEAALSVHDPFSDFYDRLLDPLLSQLKPKQVLISLAYLSQLAGTLSLCRWLRSRGIVPSVGGSLPSSMARTAAGLKELAAILPPLDLGDGMSYLGNPEGERLLSDLCYPRLLSKRPYLSCRPILPLTLSTGCFWNRCLFCPDRNLPRFMLPERSIERFLQSIPGDVLEKRPLIHLLDSAMPPGRLRPFMAQTRALHLAFYGFARPSREILPLIPEASASGCTMLQLGVESGSKQLLDRFQKGLWPEDSRMILRAAAKSGIRTYAYMLFGLPTETEADRASTVQLLREESDAIDFLNLSLFNLPRDCELWDRAEEFGMELALDQNEFPLQLYRPFTCGGVPPRVAARRFIEDQIQDDPKIRPAFLRTPRAFRAAHLALMRLPHRNDP